MNEYHFIGIGGIGMSALANLMLDEGATVSGSDLNLNAIVQKLKARGAIIEQGHSSKHVSPHQTVVYSTAMSQKNPEMVAAKDLGCNLMHRSELLAKQLAGKLSVAITGTHGKTTVSSMLAHVLKVAGYDPSFAIGGILDGTNGAQTKSNLFVLEADESDGSFTNYYPTHAIITNIEAEHLEHHGSEQKLRESFDTFINQVSEHLIYCGDELNFDRGISYGFEAHNAFHITSWRQQGWKIYLDFTFENINYQDVEVAAIGKHNVLNSVAVFAMALKLGLNENEIRSGLTSFCGVERRAHIRREEHSILFIDDYAHHPTEIATTLSAIACAEGERRLVVLFQPHRYTRTAEHFDAFAACFGAADKLFISDIYAASEQPLPNITGEHLAKAAKATYLPKERWSELESFLRPHDIFITVGAGDVTNFEPNPKQKYRVGVVYGGASKEHEISKRSAKCVLEAIDRNLYDVQEFYIDLEGNWQRDDIDSCDLFLPILHGTYGEDGAIQGLFEMMQKPYSGPSWRACALSMDKHRSKIVASSAGVDVPVGFAFTRGQWKASNHLFLKRATDLDYPIFVKPNHLGSSIGITKLKTSDGLEQAIERALQVDNEVLIEQSVENAREFEFAVMGNYDVRVPAPGEKLAHGTFVDFEMKYTAGKLETTIHAKLNPKILQEGQMLAKRVYQALGCSGFARIDFLLDQQNRWWFFEANPLPGMTSLSLFPKIWEREGMSYRKMIDQMIILALQRARICVC